ncbi:non-homologous end-joining DNA ligase [Fodinibius sediminis]|uniref:Bifunctional non-homologous end joining protein LigD n=1 Tax=Fodinibius sediminis TaxID=1214077 RepID=A0A521CGK5_9BACT|nr:non-homologous end-joining DNA ligase [Fodinibius sediminis]SMO58573.1 bifunctional non-homologous end joining protein LigD [Fodinibius sediminis]
MSPSQEIRIGDHTIEIDNLDKVFFPGNEVTKGRLLDYYRAISDVMLPHLEDRPLTLQRFPDGIGGEGFYQKKVSDHFPGWIGRTSVMLKGEDKKQEQLFCNDAATLAYLVGQGTIAFHIWQSRRDKLHHPDRLVFDLDPPDDNFEPVRKAARELKRLLESVELTPFVMTTGSRGLHVVTPLDRSHNFEAVRTFAKDIANLLTGKYPDRYTTDIRKDKRGDRLFLDYLHNAYGQNSIAPYSVRPLKSAPVATPLDWDELNNGKLHAQSYTLKNILRRMGQKKDPWTSFKRHARSLDTPRRLLEDI